MELASARLHEVATAVARSHQNHCTPFLRGWARRELGLGECEEYQDCPCRENECGWCKEHRASTA